MKRAIILLAFALLLTGGLFSQHFVPEWWVTPPPNGQNPYLAHNVYVYAGSINGVPLGPGFEIGVFDEDELVGAITITTEADPLHPWSINCSTEGGGVPGSAEIGDFMYFRVWDGTTEYTYPEMSVEFHEPPTWDDGLESVFYFASQASTHVEFILYETPEAGDTTQDYTVPAGTTYYVSNLDFDGTGFTLDSALISNPSTADITDNISVYTFDENSTDTYYNAADPAQGTVPVANYSSYGWVVDPGQFDFVIVQPTFPLTYTFDLSAYGPSISDPSDFVLLYRPIHGTSYFNPVQNYVYDPINQTITVSLTNATNFAGEYIIGSLNEEDPLPVELSSFTAMMNNYNSAVNLTWVTQSEENMVGYRIYRGASEILAEAMDQNTLIEAANTSQTTVYMYSDTEIEAGQEYHYWLEALDLDGSNQFYGPIFIATPGQGSYTPTIPLVTELSSLYPNPFNPELTISYSLESSLPVRIDIVNIRGQIIKTLVNETKEAGTHRQVWNGIGTDGRSCSSGVYFVRMRAGSEEFFAKAMLMK